MHQLQGNEPWGAEGLSVAGKAAASENNQKKSNGRGGKRVGAGRKTGSATKKTREIADRASAEGITPLEVMLDNMRFAHLEAHNVLGKLLEDCGDSLPDAFDSYKELLRFRGMAQEAAKDAAPYLHPRLASIEHSGKDGGAIDHSLTVKFE
jgi:hypothetical protein